MPWLLSGVLINLLIRGVCKGLCSFYEKNENISNFGFSPINLGQNGISEWSTKCCKGLISLLCQNVLFLLLVSTQVHQILCVCIYEVLRKGSIVIYISENDFTELLLSIRLVFYQKIFNKFYVCFPNTLYQCLLNIYLLYFL